MRAVEFRPLREGDIEHLIAHLRPDDLAEVHASTDQTIEDAVVESVRASVVLYAIDIDGRLACLFGVSVLSMAPLVGAPWLLGTSWLDENPRALVSASRGYIPHLLGSFKQLLNYVDARNVRSIRWLKGLGFTIRAPEPYGPRGLPFHRFDRGF